MDARTVDTARLTHLRRQGPLLASSCRPDMASPSHDVAGARVIPGCYPITVSGSGDHRDLLVGPGGLHRLQGNLDGAETILTGDRDVGIVPDGVDEGSDHLRVTGGFDRLPGEARPLRFGHLAIVVEGVGEEHARLTDDVDRHATPNRPVLRPRPAGIEADRHAVAHAEHAEAGVTALATRAAVAGFGVDLAHLGVVDPAEDVDDVNGVVDDGAATGERGVDEPAARVRTGVTRGDGQRLADHAAPDRVTQAGDGGVEADREGGHELAAVLLA